MPPGLSTTASGEAIEAAQRAEGATMMQGL